MKIIQKIREMLINVFNVLDLNKIYNLGGSILLVHSLLFFEFFIIIYLLLKLLDVCFNGFEYKKFLFLTI